MIECIFTIDYEIYGDGEGMLRDLVLDPARDLNIIFEKAGSKFVVFVEAAEFEKIEAHGTDPDVKEVRQQIREFYQKGHEIALHLHPQWCNAFFQKGRWVLNYEEYNLCSLPPGRIAEIINNAISYLRALLGEPYFTPIAFRAGNWLFQPTKVAAKVLAAQGIKIDSSVFKGGLQHLYLLDYRSAMDNGFFWRFSDDVNLVDPKGILLEMPIHTQMVPFWKLITPKRVGLQKKGGIGNSSTKQKLYRTLDRLRLQQPLKLDFCRMKITELTGMISRIISEDRQDPLTLRPIVAIGHTKDLFDFETVSSFLNYLKNQGIKVTTFNKIFPYLQEKQS